MQKRNVSLFFLRFLVIFLLIFLALERTDGFEERKIYGEEKFWEESYFAPHEEEEMPFFSQPFFYLGKGKQCYVFSSEDGKYVVKFLNFATHSQPWITQFFPFLDSIYQRKEKRKKAFFQGYHLDDLLKESNMTATLRVHLICQPRSKRELLLYDKWHRKHSIFLDATAYVLQRKVAPFFPWLQESLFSEELFRKKMRLYLDLLFLRLEKKIYDPDGRLLEHVGVVEDRLFFIDHGRIYLQEKLGEEVFFRKKIYEETKKVRKFLMDQVPQKAALFDQEIERRLKLLFPIS